MNKNQKGMTVVGWLLTLALIGLAGLVGVRLVPVYIEAYSVGSVLNSMESEGRLGGSTRSEIREIFKKRLQINDFKHVRSGDLTFTEVAGGMQMVVDYEARVPLLGNLDAVARFRKEAVIRN